MSAEWSTEKTKASGRHVVVPGIKSESNRSRESANWGQKRRSTKDLPLPQMLARVLPPFSFNSTEINYEHHNHICSTHKNVKT